MILFLMININIADSKIIICLFFVIFHISLWIIELIFFRSIVDWDSFFHIFVGKISMAVSILIQFICIKELVEGSNDENKLVIIFLFRNIFLF